MQVLSNFRQTSLMGMLKRVNKERVRCPVVFYEEMIAVFMLKSISKWPRNRQKKPKFSRFQSFYAIFVNFSISRLFGLSFWRE